MGGIASSNHPLLDVRPINPAYRQYDYSNDGYYDIGVDVLDV